MTQNNTNNKLNFLITGANSGIGYATVQSLLKEYNKDINCILMACRNREKAMKAIDELATKVKIPDLSPDEIREKLKFLPLDLADMENIEKCVKEEYPKFQLPCLDILILNAGVVAPGKKKLMFETNVLGHFLLSRLLVPELQKSPHGKMIFVASEAHNKLSHKLKEEQSIKDYVYDGDKNSGMTTVMGEYGFTKLADMWLTREFHKRFGPGGSIMKDGKPVYCNSLHPGGIRTNIGYSNTSWLMKPFAWTVNLFLKSPEEGCKTSVHVAMSPDAHTTSGEYFSDSKIAAEKDVHKEVYNEKRSLELWNLCEELCNEKLGRKLFPLKQEE